MFGTIGWPEILLILAVALLLFGAKRLPEIGRSLGKGIKEFKKSITEISEDLEMEESKKEKSKEEEKK
ncbi:twin-arginine translocase TatA/TatE family subunit [candidate division WOR-3 bacterium]|nr:twin-arginine translocase TatA/TatE family subunit [candidate division WOR-3 bacterium]MCK4528049.1 twin-arginine translocase TatA/TatE family subunit [candidate division WOR-3 bacterium]